jgi:uncharacterized protein with gpF-like domain
MSKPKVPVNPKALAALIERNLSYFEGLVDDTRKKMMAVLTDGLTQGVDIWTIRDQLVDLGYDKNRAEMIARTESMYALNEGAKESYREVGIEYVKWLTSYDDRTCTEENGPPIELPDGSVVYGCEAMDGKIFKLDECPAIPVHPNCRCAISASRGPEDY